MRVKLSPKNGLLKPSNSNESNETSATDNSLSNSNNSKQTSNEFSQMSIKTTPGKFEDQKELKCEDSPDNSKDLSPECPTVLTVNFVGD